MSSKRVANRALGELFELAGKAALLGGEVVFKTYAKMRLRGVPRVTYNKKLKRFEQYGFVEKRKTTDGNVFMLTNKAKKLRARPTSKILRKDGFSSLIIFDIPESKHNVRDTFRRFLIRNGYIQIQRSCFLSPFKISDDILELIKELKIEKNISTFSSKVDYLIT